MLKHFAIWHIHINSHTTARHVINTLRSRCSQNLIKRHFHLKCKHFRIWISQNKARHTHNSAWFYIPHFERAEAPSSDSFVHRHICGALFPSIHIDEMYRSPASTARQRQKKWCKFDWQGIGAATSSPPLPIWFVWVWVNTIHTIKPIRWREDSDEHERGEKKMLCVRAILSSHILCEIVTVWIQRA